MIHWLHAHINDILLFFAAFWMFRLERQIRAIDAKIECIGKWGKLYK